MNEKIYYSAEDIAKMLGVSMGKSYKILREMNKELAGKGFLTICLLYTSPLNSACRSPIPGWGSSDPVYARHRV